MNRLLHVDMFAFGGIGFAGATSQGEKDYRAIVSRSSAHADFEYLFEAGNPAAKSYALVGIHRMNQEKFNSLMRSLTPLQYRSVVTTMQGCLMRSSPLGAVAKAIQAGAFPG